MFSVPSLHTNERKILMMTDSAGGDEVKESREDALERYVTFSSREWSEGGVRVCEDTQLMEEAKRAVFTRGEEALSFTLLPFYTTVNYAINTTNNNNNNAKHTNTTSFGFVLRRLSKAFEVLELLCINLFLFPWKKEFKTLKKFTGYFVYYIQAVLPPPTTRRVLQHIGYDSETHNEYQLSHSADPNCAKEMSFELFLARVECERLIQMMSQKSDAECLDIIQNLGSAASLKEEPELRNVSNGDLEEDGARKDNFLLQPEPSLIPSDQEKSQHESLKHDAFLSEDKSILEMQKDYPDLAFRQRPIFKSSSTKPKRSAGRDVKRVRKTSSSRSVTSHADAPEPCDSEEQQPCVDASSHTPGFKQDDSASVTDLAEMMDKLKLKDFPGEEPLKCPVEETKKTIPILCSRSHQSLCSIAGCDSCSASDRLQQHHDITEPPQSFYIPSRVSGSAVAPPAGHEEDVQLGGRAGTEPGLHQDLEIL